MNEYKPITRSIKETKTPTGIKIHIGETEDEDFQLHFYKDGALKFVKKCYHENDAIAQHEKHLNRYYMMGLKGIERLENTPVKPIKKRIGVYETIDFSPYGAFDPSERRTLENLLRVIETPIYTRKGKLVINYKNKVFQVHKNNVPMAIKSDADYILNMKTDIIDTKK